MTDLSSVDVCKMIKACREAGVSEFEWNGVKLKLGVFEGKEKAPVGIPDPENVALHHAQVEQRLKEEELDHLKLTDPLAYENYVSMDMTKEQHDD